MKIVQETAFSGKTYWFVGPDLLASYTATRDMLLTVCVHTTTALTGIVGLLAKVDNRKCGPQLGWAGGAASVTCLGRVFPLAVKKDQQLDIYMSSDNAGDNSESGTVFIAELDVPTEDLYTAVIERLRDDLATTAADEWTALFCTNGVPLTAGVTNAKLSVYQRSDGAALFTDKTMTAIGSTGAFKYDATGDERGSDGETLIAVASATIDGATRTFIEIIATDRIAVG